MKKQFTRFSLTALLVFGCYSLVIAGNDNTAWTIPYPGMIWDEILSENFQNWPSTRTYSSDPLQCNATDRATNYNWTNIRIKRTSGTSGFKANVYLHNCEIQPFCDTQSGTFYAIDTAVYPNAARDHIGLTNPGVSVGNITVLDTTTINEVPYDKGWVVVGQMMHIDLIQYTISNFGNKRGFRLEYSKDQGKTWVLIRNERGNNVNDTINSTSRESLNNSPKGTVWEDQISLDDVMLRFSRANANAQLFRIHDLRIYGIGLLEDMNDDAFEANSGITWGEWMGVDKTKAGEQSIRFCNGIVNFSEVPVWSKVSNLYGQTVRSYDDQQVINLTDLPKGVYFVRMCGLNGKTKATKICL
ncbi:MAG: hypothetical protein Q8914_03595 [Bacteroidota bacterium]|nr:hypothetical protein [Bacteroidota bacterium]